MGLPWQDRIRWDNVARAGLVLLALLVVVSWPHLAAPAPEAPPAAIVPATPAEPLDAGSGTTGIADGLAANEPVGVAGSAGPGRAGAGKRRPSDKTKARAAAGHRRPSAPVRARPRARSAPSQRSRRTRAVTGPSRAGPRGRPAVPAPVVPAASAPAIQRPVPARPAPPSATREFDPAGREFAPARREFGG